MTEERSRSSDFVQSLERGLAVIRAFDAEHRELALSDVARSTGLTRAAARRFLLTLVKLPYLAFDLASAVLLLWLVREPKRNQGCAERSAGFLPP